MKYGESIFDILYLIFAIAFGILIIIKHKDNKSLLMGIATLLLGCGDAFHLIPRVLNYFIDKDFTSILGIGKLITSITMTIFYVLFYHILISKDKLKDNKILTVSVYTLSIIRIVLCLLPQNGWTMQEPSYLWGIIRNIPFVILGTIIVTLFYIQRKQYNYKFIWIYITLSFVFYLIVVFGASFVPILGMFMLPKTICYILMIITFYNYLTKFSTYDTQK